MVTVYNRIVAIAGYRLTDADQFSGGGLPGGDGHWYGDGRPFGGDGLSGRESVRSFFVPQKKNVQSVCREAEWRNSFFVIFTDLEKAFSRMFEQNHIFDFLRKKFDSKRN